MARARAKPGARARTQPRTRRRAEPPARVDAASCTPQAVAAALAERGLKCARCASYAVVPVRRSRERYTCCGCGVTGDFSAFVRVF